jgi:transcriptional regulator with XRE-family HTH domain
MPVEQELKTLILQKYRSVRAFSEETGIPYSTIDSIFKRGIANSSVSNIIKICRALGIDADSLGDGTVEPRRKEITAAAAHFNIDKLTPEGIERYMEFMEFLAQKYSKD